MTTQTPRRPLAEIDVRGTDAVQQLNRILPAEPGSRSESASTFNSAL